MPVRGTALPSKEEHMFALFRALLDRLKALLLTDAALDLEGEVPTHSAERKARLLRQAAAFEAEGLALVASELRRQAAALDLSRPLTSVLPAAQHVARDAQAAPQLAGQAATPGAGVITPSPSSVNMQK